MMLDASGIAASVNPSTLTPHKKISRRDGKSARQEAHADAGSQPRSALALRHTARTTGTTRRHHYYERFHTSSFASEITEGDVTAGEDPVVRQAAIDALGNMNGTVVAIEPTSGRILAMVNQKLRSLKRRAALLDHQAFRGLGRVERRRYRQGDRSLAWAPQPHESYRSAGALE